MKLKYNWPALWDLLHKKIENHDELLHPKKIIALMDRLECEMIMDVKRKAARQRAIRREEKIKQKEK